MTEWFDSHCHVDEEKFDEDRDTVLARMREHGITRFAVIGSDMETSRHAIAFAKQHPGAVAAGGFHRCTVKVDHTKHGTMVCDRHAVHSKLFRTHCELFDLTGSVQKTILCMNM